MSYILVRSLTDFDAKSSSVLQPFFLFRLCILSVPVLTSRTCDQLRYRSGNRVEEESSTKVTCEYVSVNDDRLSSHVFEQAVPSFQKAERGRGH
eukprot:scaffold236409_cov25-Attheya_sp.AAC.2